MHVARYLGNYSRKKKRNTLLEVGAYYQIEYAADDKVIDVMVYPIKSVEDEYWEGHVEYKTLQDAFDDWDDICEEVRDLKPFKVKKAKVFG